MENLATKNTAAAEAQTQAVAPTAPVVVKTKQELLRDALVNGPTGENGERIAIVTQEGELFIAKFADHEIARVKRCEDLAGLLIDHRYTQKAKWAGVTELKFECTVPEGTPFKAGMSKKADRTAGIAKGLIEKIDALNLSDAAALKGVTKADLVTLLGDIKTALTAA